MSKAYLNLGHILASKWMINSRFADAYYPLVLNLLDQIPAEKKEDFVSKTFSAKESSSVYFVSEFGDYAPPSAAPEDSVAVIGVQGVITKYDQWCGNAGMLTKAALLDQCMSNPNIKGVILSFDTGGGDGMATELFASKIKNATKPVVAYINGTAASAGYWLASAASHIIVDGQTSEVGSIGSYVTIRDFKERLKAMGITERRIYAPQSKLKNKAYEDALKGEDEAMLQDLATFNSFFIEAVKANRGSKLSTNKAMFQGAMFYADEALQEGLIDAIGDFQSALDYIDQQAPSAILPSSTNNLKNNMKKLTISARFASLLSLFNTKVDEGKESAEVDLTEEKLSELNSLAGKVTTLEGDLKAAQDAKKAAEDALAKANTDLEAANTKITELGQQAGQLGKDPNTKGAEGGAGKKESLSILPPTSGDDEYDYNY